MDQEATEDSGSSSAIGNGTLPLGVAPGKKNIPVKKSLCQYLLVKSYDNGKHRKALLNSLSFRKPQSSSQPAPCHQPCISAGSKY